MNMKLQPVDAARFQITTYEAWSQFSRVADQSIIAGLTAADVATRVAHLTVEQRMAITSCMHIGKRISFTDLTGKTNIITRHA
jgi:hypothetical protein